MSASAPSAQTSRVIHLHLDAPAKPPEGATCNGCGVCCATEPCPLGVLISRRRSGACDALQWSDGERRYLCGMVSAPKTVLPWLPSGLTALASRLARRWIASAAGCDASLVTEAS